MSFLVNSYLGFSQSKDFYPITTKLIKLAKSVYVSGDKISCKKERDKKIILYSDTLNSVSYKIKTIVDVASAGFEYLGGPVMKSKAVMFEIFIIEDTDSLYYWKMLNEVKEFYSTKKDSVLNIYLLNKNYRDSTFDYKSFIFHSADNIILYITDNFKGDGTYYLASLGNLIIKIELENYVYPTFDKEDYINAYTGKYPLNSFVNQIYFENQHGKFNVFYDGMMSQESKRHLYQKGMLK